MAKVPHIPVQAAAYTGERAVEQHRVHEAANQNRVVDGFAPAPSAVASGLERFNSVVGMPMMVGFFATMLSVPIGWMTSWNKTLNTYVKGALGSVNSAMQTPMGELHKLRANAAQPLLDAANENKLYGKAAVVEGWQARATAADAARLKGATEAVDRWSVGAGAAQAGTGLLDRAVVNLAEWRHKAVEKNIAKTAERLTMAHEREAVGFFQRAANFVMRKEAPMATVRVAHAEPLMAAAGGVRGGVVHAQDFAQTMTHFSTASKDLQGAAQAQAMAIERHAGKLAGLAQSRGFWQQVQKGGVKALTSGLPKALGRMPLMHGLFALTAATGAVALLARTKTENVAKTNVLHSFAADVLGTSPDKVTDAMLSGPNANPLVARAANDVKAFKRGKGMTNSVHIAIDGAFAAMPNPGMMMVPMMMGGQVVGDLLGHETLMLDAYAMLKMAETGKGMLEPKHHLQLVRSLVAASPTIAAHGGVYNKMALPIAQAMVAEKLSVRQILGEISTPNAMELRAAKVTEAAKAKAPEAAPVVAANQNAAPNIAGPAKIAASSASHEGMVAGQSLQRQ